MKKLQICTIGLSLLYIPQSFADITLNGFASIRATQVNSDGGSAPFGFKEGEITFKDESLFAIQARADLTEGLTATIQLYADGWNDFDVEARWAYISYQVADNHTINIGKLANPLFHQSEYEKVGYAHNFSRLPMAVYTGFDFATMEGISLNSQFDIADGDYTLDTKWLYGSWDGDITLNSIGNVDLGLKDILSFNATFSGDWWKVFAGAFVTEMVADSLDANSYIPAIQPGVQAALSLGATQSDVTKFTENVIWHEKDGLYWFAGFGIDRDDWILDFEYTNYGVQDSVDAPNENWYLALGKRFDSYVITIHAEESKQPEDYGFLNGINHPVLQATGKGLQGVLAASEWDGYGISLRYDFHPSAALKVDYFTGENQISDIGDYQIMSAGIDLVF
ncbi:MAG: hypothetical protein KC484_00270 [Colwelliaceae bacterium]|nr:hypothetical protein [Colwelliaceae bacterium]